MSFPCDALNAVGNMNVRDYTITDCIEVKRVFAIRYGLDVYGTHDFDTILGFNEYRNSYCVPCGRTRICCPVTYNGCLVTYNGQTIYSRNLN